MRTIFAVTVSALALGAAARPATSNVPRDSSCMSYADANQVANNFADLIRLPFNKTLAETSMCTDFKDYSDSVSELINVSCQGSKTLGQATFDSLDDFIQSQSGQSPIPFDILKVWNACDTVIFRWTSSGPGSVVPEEEVTGIVVLETTPSNGANGDQPFLIETAYSEFNSGAWLYDLNLGNLSTSCASTKRSTGNIAPRSLRLRPNIRGPGRLF